MIFVWYRLCIETLHFSTLSLVGTFDFELKIQLEYGFEYMYWP